MANVLIHLRRLLLIITVLHICGTVCDDLTSSLLPAELSRTVAGQGRLHSYYGGAAASGSGTKSRGGAGAEPIELPRKFHLQLWIYIYSFLIYAVLVGFTVL